MCACSLREAALQVLEKELLDNKLKGNPKDVFRTLAKAACTVRACEAVVVD